MLKEIQLKSFIKTSSFFLLRDIHRNGKQISNGYFFLPFSLLEHLTQFSKLSGIKTVHFHFHLAAMQLI